MTLTFLRRLLLPFVPIYYGVTYLRNWLYDKGIKRSKSYETPIICVGNLSTGGTGKTPMIEYLVRLLKTEKQIATLSRGYKRISEGYVLANEDATTDTIGDEPFQFYRKFKTINVAVDSNRQNGIEELLKLTPKPEVILLDDAYQHRKVTPGFSILLTAYNTLYSDDIVLPTGNLREPRSGAKRADVIVVTKCPETISDIEKKEIISRLKPNMNQKISFSSIKYSTYALAKQKQCSVENLPSFTLVTGIANASPLVHFLKSKHLSFEHLNYPDHYSFKPEDIELFSKKKLLLCTEKDYVRLADNESLEDKLYYLPIVITIDNATEFNAEIYKYLKM